MDPATTAHLAAIRERLARLEGEEDFGEYQTEVEVNAERDLRLCLDVIGGLARDLAECRAARASDAEAIRRLKLEAFDAELAESGARDEIGAAVQIIFDHAEVESAANKQWVLDQVLRNLLGNEYDNAVDGLGWDTGVKP